MPVASQHYILLHTPPQTATESDRLGHAVINQTRRRRRVGNDAGGQESRRRRRMGGWGYTVRTRPRGTSQMAQDKQNETEQRKETNRTE
ncbi:hypothetical protein BKA93DRAFT_84235 [Sparassis latifolia]